MRTLLSRYLNDVRMLAPLTRQQTAAPDETPGYELVEANHHLCGLVDPQGNPHGPVAADGVDPPAAHPAQEDPDGPRGAA